MNLGQIRTSVREFLNEPFAAFWSDAVLNTWINVAVPKCTNLIKNTSRYHFTTRVTFQTVVGQDYYQLPGDCKDLKFVSVITDDGSELPLAQAPWPNPFLFTEDPLPTSANNDANDIPAGYWIVGASIRVLPVPSSVLTFRLYYEARLIQLIKDSDTPTFDADYHDMASVWAAKLSRVKNGEGTGDLDSIWASRENDLIQDVFHRFPMPSMETSSYLQGLP